VKERFTALVPMKGESERVPGKNLRPLCDRPLFHWIMQALRESRYIGEIVVNTDSEEIARSAQQNFSATIVWRPEHLVGHMVGIVPLIEYDLSQTSGDYFVQTHSTNPLLRAETIDRAIEAFMVDLPEHDSLFTVTPRQTRFYWPDGSAINHDPTTVIRTQDLDPIYEENSCLYLFTRSSFERSHHRIGARPLMFSLDAEEAVDIDQATDFIVAEALMRGRLEAGQVARRE